MLCGVINKTNNRLPVGPKHKFSTTRQDHRKIYLIAGFVSSKLQAVKL